MIACEQGSHLRLQTRCRGHTASPGRSARSAAGPMHEAVEACSCSLPLQSVASAFAARASASSAAALRLRYACPAASSVPVPGDAMHLFTR